METKTIIALAGVLLIVFGMVLMVAQSFTSRHIFRHQKIIKVGPVNMTTNNIGFGPMFLGFLLLLVLLK
jgi:hypothetical protein